MPRPYRSPRREAEAATTRASVIAAAERLFIRDGYAATSLRSIAAEAGVSVPTVQQQGPKHALLIAAFEVAFAGDEGAHALAERPAMAAIMSEPDVDIAIDRYVAYLDEANVRAAGIVRAMAAAADADPMAREAYQELEGRRQRDMAIAAGWFVGRGLIPADRALDAADLLGYILSADAYVYFTGSRQWTREQWMRWTAHQLRRLSDGLPPAAPQTES